MLRLLLIIGLSAMLFAGCKKDGNVANQVKQQAAIDDQILQNYITTNKLQGTFGKAVGDSTGLWYTTIPQGTNSALYSTSTLVTVGYTGKVLNADTTFIKTDNFHPSFRLSEMIKGWSLSLLKSRCDKGKTIRILMASRYAYGPYEQPSLHLPANSILDFQITVYDVVN
ncbi:FKBP-type peptidyl-prolyl cis-trans isomerase [Mucilaginibacter sp.]